MAIYGPNGTVIDESKQAKGQEYISLHKSVDKYGNINNGNEVRMGTTSGGRAGVLDSIAQNHIEDIDLEREKLILESKDILNEYLLYLDGEWRKAVKQYDDQSKSQIEKRMIEDVYELEQMGIDQSKIYDLVISEYYGVKNIIDLSKNRTTDDIAKAEKIIKTILKLRINYVNKITSLMTKIIKNNYISLGLSEQEAKIYIDNLSSGTNDSVKAAGDIIKLIRSNKKYVVNNGQSIDLRSLGFGVILAPLKGYELSFAGTDLTNKGAMLNLIQSAMRYDVVLIAHGLENANKNNEESKKILDYLKDADISFHEDQEPLMDIIESLSKEDREDIYSIKGAFKLKYPYEKISQLDELKRFIKEELYKIINSKSKNLTNSFKTIALEATKKFYNENEFKKSLKDIYKQYGQDAVNEVYKVYNSKRDIIVQLTEKYFTENIFLLMRSTLIRNIKGDDNFFWGCQPTRTLNSGPFDDVNELVRQLIKEGYKKILIKDCNPGGHKLDDDIMKTKGILINYSDFSNFAESYSIDSNDKDLLIIYEAELSLKEFAESYGIDYYDNEYLEECCQWYINNIEIIEEGVIDNLEEFFKKILAGIIGFFKKIFNLVKLALSKLKTLFGGTKEEPKNTKTNFQKPIKTPLIDISSKKVVEIASNNREELDKESSKMCHNMANEIKKLNQSHQTSLRKIEQDINRLSKQTNNESFGGFIDMLDKYFIEDADFMDTIEYLHEFDADGAPASEDEEEDFSMDDEGGEKSQTTEEPPAEEGSEDEEEEFSMDDEGEEETQDDEGEETPASDEDEEENFELPEDEEGEGEETPAAVDDGEEEFSMDDDSEGSGEETTDDNTDDGSDDTSDEDSETNTKLKELESVIFDDLTDEEKNMKITELKALYITVYKKCGTISDMLTGIRRDEETIQIVEYISNTLIDLKEYVNDYINKVFDSKTYIENLSQLQKYIMIFNAINKVFEQIKSEKTE